MEARIRQLDSILAHAVVREAADDGKVGIGSVVTVVDSDGDEMAYFVANPANKQPGYLLASPESPLGKALLGAAPGDEVTTTSRSPERPRPFRSDQRGATLPRLNRWSTLRSPHREGPLVKLRLRSPRQFARQLLVQARREPEAVEEYLDAHGEEWEALAEAAPGAAAAILEELDEEALGELIGDLDPAEAADVLVELQPEVAADLLEDLSRADAAALLEEMSPEDAADILVEVDEPGASNLIGMLTDSRPPMSGGCWPTRTIPPAGS